jgi:hypothetical protein
VHGRLALRLAAVGRAQRCRGCSGGGRRAGNAGLGAGARRPGSRSFNGNGDANRNYCCCRDRCGHERPAGISHARPDDCAYHTAFANRDLYKRTDIDAAAVADDRTAALLPGDGAAEACIQPFLPAGSEMA